MDKINVAVIGTGVMGQNHARVYSALENTNLVSICDVNEDAKSIADKYKINFYNDYNEMLKNEKINAVSLCVPTKLHKKAALDVIKNNINILIEKPIATTIEDAEEIVNEAEKHSIKLMVGHIERFNPVVAELRKRIQSNELGKILQVHCQRLSLFPQRIKDVGVIVDLAIHEIDILRYLIDSKIKRVYAETAQRFHSTHEDLLIGTIRFGNNVLGIINANWLTPKKVREIKVTGEKGMFVGNYLSQELYFYEKQFASNYASFSEGFIKGKEGKRIKIGITKSEPLKNELASFADCVINNNNTLVGGNEGIETLKIACKFLESSKSNKVVTL